ncbi:MAG TPA: alpha/beta hydrolase [Bryobacteraceae bacterium]|nr:alpha/beta hydrolase [Bryobacteraceae bacterium]
MNTPILDLPPPAGATRIAYGDAPQQFGDLRLPSGGQSVPVAIVIHGGYWRNAYSLDHIGHLCAALTRAGVAAWSLEYRRLGDPGGGWPAAGDDVRRGAEHLRALARRYPLDLARVIVIGHSAGGQLALWLAAQHAIPLRGVVALAAVSDLRRAWELHLSRGVVAGLLGGQPDQQPERYHQASPIELVPLHVRQRLLHGTRDDVVPIEISRRYQAAATAAGDDARLIELPNAGHFELIDPRTTEWKSVQAAVLDLLQ